MKRFIVPIIICVCIITLIIVVTRVDFGALTISILERTAHVEIDYRTMQGNLFRGYRIEGYNVKLSETDSIYGKIADISYRFKPLAFRLPNLFEINLIEPNVHMKKKTDKEEERKFRLPQFNVALRINIKNGKVIYEDEKSYTVESISGLVFVDLIGPQIYLNTVNLSLKAKEYPVAITSANLDLTISSKIIEAHSFRINGSGIFLHGEGLYSFENNEASLKIERAKIDMEKFHFHRGTIDFSGEVDYLNNKFLPRIKGTAQGIDPIHRCAFETNVFADTIVVNIFDAELWGGSLFAQAKISHFKIGEFEANFTEFDIGNIINVPAPILVSGYLGYRSEKFICSIKSPADSGLGIDSLVIFGSATTARIALDSLAVFEPKKTLEISGDIYPLCDLNMRFDKFTLEKFSQYVPLQGMVRGMCSIQGDLKKPADMLFSSDITVDDLVVDNCAIAHCSIMSKNMRINDKTGYSTVTAKDLSYKNQILEKVTFVLENRSVFIHAKKQNDSLRISGMFEKNWQGTISSLYLIYNGVETKTQAPIAFDIPTRMLGDIDLSIIDGRLRGTLSPLELRLSKGNLNKLGMLLGLKEQMYGTLDISVSEGSFSIRAQDIDYSGLSKGSLTAIGEYSNQSIRVESLTVSDEKEQNVHASGHLSIDTSRVRINFSNVGAWALPFLNNFLDKPDGILSGDITFRGNLENYTLTGFGKIKNGSFGIEVIAAQFDSLNSNVRFDNNRIIFENARGKVSTLSHLQLSQANGAEVHAGGVVKLDPRFGSKNYNFDLSFQDAPIQFLPFAYGIGSGNFSVGMKEGTSYYNGNITVKQAIVPIEFGMELEEQEEEVTENWTLNIKLKGERNIWLRNSDADIEFGGELYIIKEQGPVYLSGKFETHRGNYYWLNHILSITQGQVTFIPEEKLDGELDFWAEMNTREGIKIILHFFGPMSEPVFEFFSDPPIYSEQDIITYLNLNITWKELESMKQGDYVGQILPHSLVSWLESDVSRRIRQKTGLDYFRIETPFFEPESKTRVTVGKYISRDLFISYTYDITSFSNEFNVEYFIDDKNEILIRKDEEAEYSLQYQYRIRF